MLDDYNIASVLEMEDVLVTKVDRTERAIHIYLEMPRREHQCPHCKNMTDTIHDYREQIVHDLDCFGRQTYLHYRKRRYECPVCHKRFYEKSPIVPKYQRTTQRLYIHVIEAFREKVSGTDIARRFHLSTPTVFRYFSIISFRNNHLPRVLSIDEFKGNSGGEKYNCILTDAEKRELVDVLKSRKEEDLILYFMGFPERKNVQFVSIDMNGHFDRVARACFPNATIIADRYHVIRQVFWAMENVRKAEQKHLSPEYRKYFKRSRSLLTRPPDKLTEEEKGQLTIMFHYAPRLGLAYYLKNEFYKVVHAPDPFRARTELNRWIFQAEAMKIPEFRACLTCFHNWFTEIINGLSVEFSNGYTEGMNNKIKVIKRVSFGIPSFDNLRRRILFVA